MIIIMNMIVCDRIPDSGYIETIFKRRFFGIATKFKYQFLFSRHLFSIGEILKISVDNNVLVVNGNNKVVLLDVDKWINLVIRVRT